MKLPRILPLLILGCVLLFLTLWGGGIFPSSVCISAGLLCTGAAICVAFGRAGGQRLPIATMAWCAIIVLLALSVMRLPSGVDRLTGSRRQEQNERVRVAAAEAVAAGIVDGEPAMTFALTRNRAGTLRILVLAIAMLGAAVLGGSLSPDLRKRYLVMLAVYMVAVAGAGVVHQCIVPAKKTLWWFISVKHGQPVGCFINRTHHAGFISMLCPATLVLAFDALSRGRKLAAAGWALGYVVIATGVLCSLSRGAWLSCGVGVVLTAGILLYRGIKRRRGVAATVVVLIVLIGCTALGSVFQASPAVQQRLRTLRDPMEEFSAQKRLGMWRDSLAIWRDYPVTGAGANGFRMVFPQYRTDTDSHYAAQAENEYVELLADTGLLGVVLAIVVFVGLFCRWRSNAREGTSPPTLSLCVLGAVCVAAVHNAVDFPMHVPLYAIAFASLLGMASSAPPGERGESGVRLAGREILLATLGIAVLLAAAARGTDAYKEDQPEFAPNATSDEILTALSGSPTSQELWCMLGRRAMATPTPQAAVFAEKCAAHSTEYDPNNHHTWYLLGYVRAGMGDKEGALDAFRRMYELSNWDRSEMPDTDKY